MSLDSTTSFLRGKTAIITGAGRGIGRATAERLAAGGANVVVASRTVDQLEAVCAAVRGNGGKALPCATDVTQSSDVRRLVETAVGEFGRVDVLVNNAGVAPLAPLAAINEETFDRLMATNVRSVYLCAHAVWPHMRENGGGVIVNISSMAAFEPFAGLGTYGASKSFVVALTANLAKEGAKDGIRVYGVAPGAVYTDMLRGAFPDFPEEQALKPDAIAMAIETLLSPAMAHSSGQTIMVRKGG